MSFMQQTMPQPKAFNQFHEFFGGKSIFDNGTHYFICGFGKTTNGNVWDNSDVFTNATSPIPQNLCRMWVNETSVGENGGFLNWLYTGDNDPVHDLGWAQKAQMQNMTKIKNLYGDKGFAFKYPDVRHFLPVLKVVKDGKTYKFEEAQPMVIVVKDAMLNNIKLCASKPSIADLDDPSVYGKLLSITKNTKAPSPNQMYAFDLVGTDYTAKLPEDFATTMSELRQSAIERIDQIFAEGNGGDYNSENVRRYISQQTNMSYDAFVAKYNILPDVVQVEKIQF